MLFDFTDVGNKVGAFVSKAAADALAPRGGVSSPAVSVSDAKRYAMGPDSIGASVRSTGVGAFGVSTTPGAAAEGLGGLFGKFVRGIAGGLGLDENTVKLGAVGLAAFLLLRK